MNSVISLIVIHLLCLSYCNAQGGNFRILHHFNGGVSDGAGPLGSVIQSGSTLYGMTRNGGNNNLGTIFRINKNGEGFGVLYSFITPAGDGQEPYGDPVLSDSILYGMVASEQTVYGGDVFRVNVDGTQFHVLHTFSGSSNDGKCPYDTPFLLGSTLYGMTAYGGTRNNGVIYKLNTDGSGFRLLHSFTGGASDGGHSTGNVLRSDSTLYGITFAGGAYDLGTIFKIHIDGTDFRLLHTFRGGTGDGSRTHGSLVLSGSVLYGMTTEGGNAGSEGGTIFRINTDGTGFLLLHRFAGGNDDGLGPVAGNPIVADSILYGMTHSGGAGGNGTIFQMRIDGDDFRVLHSFNGTDGKFPFGALFLSDTTLYGMTSAGGEHGQGVIFALNIARKKYTVTDLGTLGGSSSWAFALNLASQVVGSSFPAGVTSWIDPFLYSSGQMTNLNAMGGWATDINDLGQIVGTGSINGNSHAFMYNNGRTTDLGTLGGTYSEAWGVSADGRVVGWADRSDGNHHAVLYNNRGNIDLGTLGGTTSWASAINDSGQIVGESDLNGNATRHAFFYSNGFMTDMGTLGGPNSTANAVNSRGQVVGSADSPDGTGHAFLCHDGIMMDLGTLGGATSTAAGINDAGQIVGGADIAPNVGHAFIYTDGRMTDLNSLIEPSSGWVLNSAAGINNNGQIAGNGTFGGQTHAILITPKTSSQTEINESGRNDAVHHFSLRQNYPNPFNPSTTIHYSLPEAAQVKIEIFNMLGQKISTLVERSEPAGDYEVQWDARNVSSGIYFCRLTAEGRKSFEKTQKLVLAK